MIGMHPADADSVDALDMMDVGEEVGDVALTAVLAL